MEVKKLNKEQNAKLNEIEKSLAKIENETVKANELKAEFSAMLNVKDITESTKFVGVKYSYTRTIVHNFNKADLTTAESAKLDELYKAYKDYENELKAKHGNTKISARDNF